MGLFARLRSRFKTLDRRRAPRIAVDVPTDFAQEDEEVYLFQRTMNISRSGAFIATQTPLAPGVVIEVDFTLLSGNGFDGSAEKISCMAEVVRVVPPSEKSTGGMGVRFIDLTDREWNRVLDYLSRPETARGEGMRMDVAIAEKRRNRMGVDQPELAEAVAEYRQDAPGGGAWRGVEEEAVPDEELIAEVEARMSAERPGLRAVRPDEEPLRREPDPSFEVRRDGTIEAKRAQDDLGLIAPVDDREGRVAAGEK